MLRATAAMGFKSVKRVEIRAETTTPGEVRTTTDANGLRVSTSRARRTLPKLEFSVDENGAILHGPQRGLFPYYSAATSTTAAGIGPYYHPEQAASEHAIAVANATASAALGGDLSDDIADLAMESMLRAASGGVGMPTHRECDAPSHAAMMKDCVLNDTRATTLAIKFDQKVGTFVCGSSIERFSGHTGVCRVLGSKKYPIIPHSLQIGDLLRIGSVGLVVCELNRSTDESAQESLTEDEYEYIKDNYLSLPLQQTFRPNEPRSSESNEHNGDDDDDEMDDDEEPRMRNKFRAGETSDEGESEEDGQKQGGCDDQDDATEKRHTGKSQRGKDGAPKEKRFCYICYDGDEDPEGNPLVAPCKCKGDTKYVHLECLQRWNNSTEGDGANPNHKMCAVTNTEGLDVCTICKGTYMTSVRLDDGRIVSLMAKKLPPPYVTFAVVTQHETRTRSTALTNTRFQLSFANVPRSQPFLTIGRSTNNNMTLRYRTVSQLHAKIKFEDNNFCLYDASSSNGTMLFLSKPLELDWNKSVHVKIGRTILTLKSKKKWKWSGGGDDEEGGQSVVPSPLSTPASRARTPETDSHERHSTEREYADATPRRSVVNRFESMPSDVTDPSAELLSSPYAIALRQPINRTFTTGHYSPPSRESLHAAQLDEELEGLRLSNLHIDEASDARGQDAALDRPLGVPSRQSRSNTMRVSELDVARISESHDRDSPRGSGRLSLLSPRFLDRPSLGEQVSGR